MPRHPIGKPVKIIPMGDVPAALEWVGYAKKRAWELLGMQGTWRRKVIRPNADTVIRIETLAGIPRVTIEVNGVDYVTEFQVNQDGTSLNLWAGRLRSGAASVKGKSLLGNTTGHKTFLTPLGKGDFLVAREPGASVGSVAQLIKTPDGIPSGQTFNPYNPSGYALVRAGYSGVYASTDSGGNPTFPRRSHLLYYRPVPIDGFPTDPPQIMPTVVTSLNDWASFGTTEFLLTVQETIMVAGLYPRLVVADVTPFDFTFLGNNRIVVLCQAVPQDHYLPQDNPNGSSLGSWSERPKELWGMLTLTSADGGQTWATNFTSWDALGFIGYVDSTHIANYELKALPSVACYIGGDFLLATSVCLDGVTGLSIATLMRSDDAGATWYVKLTDFPMTPPSYGGLVTLGPESCGYITRERRDTDPLHYGYPHFYRTIDGGATWTKTRLPDFVNDYLPSSLTMTAALAPPSPIPTGKVAADYAQLAFFCQEPPKNPDDRPPFRVALSGDGGATWALGGIVSSSPGKPAYAPVPGSNLGMMKTSIPAFPAFPDLHNNGLTVP